MIRAARVLLAVLALALAGSTSARAAEPSIGGQLSAGGDHVSVRSDSTMPVVVVLTVDGPFTLTPSSFVLDPGDTGTASVAGSGEGHIAALLRAVTDAPSGDSATVTLVVGITTIQPGPPFPWHLVWLALLLLAALALVLRRVRPWEWRVNVTRGEGKATKAKTAPAVRKAPPAPTIIIIETIPRWLRNPVNPGRRSYIRGQGLAEYALILALVAIVAIIALIFLGSQISAQMSVIGRTI